MRNNSIRPIWFFLPFSNTKSSSFGISYFSISFLHLCMLLILSFLDFTRGASSLPICSWMSGHRSKTDWMSVIVGLSLFKIPKSWHNIFKFLGKIAINFTLYKKNPKVSLVCCWCLLSVVYTSDFIRWWIFRALIRDLHSLIPFCKANKSNCALEYLPYVDIIQFPWLILDS